jgi:hypothetical protein
MGWVFLISWIVVGGLLFLGNKNAKQKGHVNRYSPVLILGGSFIVALIIMAIYGSFFEPPNVSQPSTPQVSEKFKKMSPAEHLSAAKKSIELKNFAAVKTHLDEIPKESPEFAGAEILRNEVAEKQKRQGLENKLTSDDRALKEMDKKLNELRAKLNKYYATADDVKGLMQDVILLTVAKAAYETGKSDTEKRLHAKSEALLPKAQLILREAYASSIEEIFIKTGMDARVRASGEAKKTLRITYALMSQPLIYKFQNEIKIDDQAKNVGFSKLVYANGFESSLGKTWTVNLK